MKQRIALVGASSVGKTTVYELLKGRLPHFKYVNESTRSVARHGYPINEAGTEATQLAISTFHLQALLSAEPLILDRCYLDLVVYTKQMENVSTCTRKFIEHTWSKVAKEYTHFIYFPIEFKSVDDGVRSVNEEWRTAVDNEFQNMLKKIGRPYLTVTGSPKERVEQILNYIK